MKCSIEGCERTFHAKGLCKYHHQALRLRGSPAAPLKRRKNGEGCRKPDGYIRFQRNGMMIYGHVEVAERALGRKLPPGAEVHHVNENPSDNRPENLVICPSHAYHVMLHQRAKAYDACGHADWLKCKYCKQYDAVENLRIKKTQHSGYHTACDTAYVKARRIAKSENAYECRNPD